MDIVSSYLQAPTSQRHPADMCCACHACCRPHRGAAGAVAQAPAHRGRPPRPAAHGAVWGVGCSVGRGVLGELAGDPRQLFMV